MEETNIHLRNILRYRYEDVTRNLPCEDVLPRVFSCGIINDEEKQHICCTKNTHGSIAQSKLLMDYIMTKSDVHVKQFVNILGEKANVLYLMIDETWQLVQRHELSFPWLNLDIQEIKEHMMKVYKQSSYNLVEALSGEKFQLDLHKPDYIMPPVFDAQELQRIKIENDFLPSKEELCYKDCPFEHVGDIIQNLASNEEKRLLVCCADAGVGKTILMHRLLCQWVDQIDIMKHFMLAFRVPIRSIDAKESLLDILGKGQNRLGYLEDPMKSKLHECLLDQNIASKVIFLLDGVDEIDISPESDIYKLITGKLYPHVKVVITGRPEGKIFNMFKEDFYPCFHMNLKGTSKEGVIKYLQAVLDAVNTNQVHTEGVNNIIKQCEENMIEFHLLKIPLYLTFAGFVFIDYFKQHLSFKGFQIPKTVTQLFNIFLLILIRRWLKRRNRNEEADRLTFDKNPLGKSSNVPIDIKNKLATLGRLSYNFTLNQKYSFTEEDLMEYLIDIEDIKESGLFCRSQCGDKQFIFFRHKQLQEYMAALYLSHVKYSESSIFALTCEPILQENAQPLLVMFRRLELVMEFLFGLAPDFCQLILREFAQYGNVAIISKKEGIYVPDLNYESRLCYESEEPLVCQAMGNFLLASENIVEKNYKFHSKVSVIKYMFQNFTESQRMSLLRKWYSLCVSEQNKNIHNVCEKCKINECPCQNKELVISNLHDCLLFLLLPKTFTNITSLFVNESFISDLNLIEKVFTSLKSLYVGELHTLQDESLRNAITANTESIPTLENIKMMRKYDDRPLPVSSLQMLLKQSELKSLSLNCVDLFPHLKEAECYPLWSKLTSLEIFLYKLEYPKTVIDFIWMLGFLPNLKGLTVGVYTHRLSPTTREKVSALVPYIKQNHGNIEMLRLFGLLDYNEIIKLCDQLNDFPKLTTLGMGYEESRKKMEIIAKAIHQHSSIKQLHIGYTSSNYKTFASKVCAGILKQNSNQGDLNRVKLGVYEYENLKYDEQLVD